VRAQSGIARSAYENLSTLPAIITQSLRLVSKSPALACSKMCLSITPEILLMIVYQAGASVMSVGIETHHLHPYISSLVVRPPSFLDQRRSSNEQSTRTRRQQRKRVEKTRPREASAAASCTMLQSCTYSSGRLQQSHVYDLLAQT
jgi:hypothetical protein